MNRDLLIYHKNLHPIQPATMKSNTPPPEGHAFRHSLSRFGTARFISAFMMVPGICLMPGPLFAQKPVAANEAVPAPSAAISGTWRTSGKFSVSVRGTKVMGGDGPVWVNFKKSGAMTTEMGFPFRWRSSGGKLKLFLDEKKTTDLLGTPSAIHYSRNYLSRSGSKITGNVDCTFSFSGQTVHWVWKFTGRK